MSGYQFDLYSAHTGTGQLYEGQGRGIMVNQGYIGQMFPGGLFIRIGSTGENPSGTYGKVGDWNQMQIVARGNTLIHLMNGHVLTVGIDDDPVRRAPQGMISLQLESMGQIWYRNIWLKHL